MTRLRLGVAASSSLALLAALAVAYQHDPVARWDDAVARWVGDDLPAFVEWLARPMSWLGGIGMAVVAAAAAGTLIQRARRADAVVPVASYVVSQGAVQLLKLAFDRPRPVFDPAVDLPRTAAFPSGHAAVSMAVLVTAASLLDGRVALRLALAASVAIGLSRIALGVHWTSDVVAGWALGGLTAGALLLARCLLRPRG
jgi:undecaprenyl-diphosphatase